MTKRDERRRRVGGAVRASLWSARTVYSWFGVSIIGMSLVLGVEAQPYTEDFTTTTYRDAAGTSAVWDTTAGELRLEPFVRGVVGSLPASGQSYGIDVSGNTAFLADGAAGLLVLDITDPTLPVLMDSVATPGTAFDVAVAGNHAFVADGGSGLAVFDITDPTNVVFIVSLDTPGTAFRLDVTGDIVYVADRSSGLQVVDIRVPEVPVLMAGLDTAGDVYDVAYRRDHAFLADGPGGVRVVDMSNPYAPFLVATHPTPDVARAVAVSGDLVYAGVWGAGLEILDIGDATAPTLVGSVDTPGLAVGVTISGDRAFVADWGEGIQIVDVTDPANPWISDAVDTPGTALNLVLSGGRAFVADWFAGLQILAIDAPALPSVVSNTGPLSGKVRAAVTGDYAYVAIDTGAGSGGFQVLDVSDPAAPAPVFEHVTARDYFDVVIVGDRVVFTSTDRVEQWDISDAASPVLQNAWFGAVRRLALGGDYPVFGDRLWGTDDIDRLLLFDVKPTWVNGVPTNALLAGVEDLTISGDYLFAATGAGGVTVLEIVGHLEVVTLATLDTPGDARALDVSGDRLFVADGAGGIVVVDVTDPASPVLVGTAVTVGAANDIVVSGTTAYVSDAVVGLHAFDVSDPTSPKPIAFSATSNASHSVTLWGEYAIAGNDGSLDVMTIRQHAFDAYHNVARSLPVDGADDTIVRARVSPVASAGVCWWLSSDGGATLAVADPGAWARASVVGPDLVWRSTLSPVSDAGVGPTVSSLAIEWLGEPGPIASIEDAPDDQGGWVRMRLGRSGYDFAEEDSLPVTGYGIYRRVDGALRERIAKGGVEASASLRASAPWSSFDGSSVRELDGRQFVVGDTSEGGLPPGTWELVIFQPALQTDEYLVALPTVADSTAEGTPWSVYVVSTHTATPSIWFSSAPDSGYSTDDIAPAAPTNLAYGEPDVLTWDAAPEEDFAYHAIYGSSNVLLEGAVVLGYSVDPTFDVSAAPHDYYLVTTSDHAGNTGDPAATMHPATTGAPDVSPIPAAFAMHAARPNPFRTRTAIAFDLPAAASVDLRLHDVTGRLVAHLAEGRWSAGRHAVAWDGTDESGRRVQPGVYFLRIQADAFRESRRVVLLR